MIKRGIHLSALFGLAGCAAVTTVEPARVAPACAVIQTGQASYYADKFHGRTTASGERFDNGALTAAHKTLPFGTRLVVENEQNGRRVTVRVNDRGPFVRGRVIDLSKAAARQINMMGAGVVPVSLCRL